MDRKVIVYMKRIMANSKWPSISIIRNILSDFNFNTNKVAISC